LSGLGGHLSCWEEGEWYSVAAYFDEHADASSKKKLRSLAQKRTYLEKKGFKIQKDSRFLDLWCFSPAFCLRDNFSMFQFNFFGG
jgi:hypothetical protein